MRHHPLTLFLAALTAAAPSVAAAEQGKAAAEAAKPLAIDVVLRQDGLLIGQLVSESGAPRAGEAVSVKLADGRSAEAKTTADGGFAFRGVEGVATIRSQKSLAVVRSWNHGVAPPSATPALLLVEGDAVARGQHYVGAGTQGVVDKSKRFFANPLFVAGVVATAVAIPIAIANDDDPAS